MRGQYGVGEKDGKIVPPTAQENGVAPTRTPRPTSRCALDIDNWRWAGVPFFLRSGKRLRGAAVRRSPCSFKRPPTLLFREFAAREGCAPTAPRANWLVMRIQPDEGIALTFACKRPGMALQLDDVTMDFTYGEAFRQRSPEAYERLLLDALRGDASLFTRSDEVEYAWRFITSIFAGWAELPPPAFPNYYPFTEGPVEAHRLMQGTNVRWRPIGGEAGC